MIWATVSSQSCFWWLYRAFFGIAFLWVWNENRPFPFLWHCWVFQICWYIDWSTFTASSFRIWSSSTGILSPPLALFIVMLPKDHLTSHSRMSGSRWVNTPPWSSEFWRSFVYSSVYSCHLFLGPYYFCPLLCPSLHEKFFFVSLIFLKRSLVFSILLFSSICTGHLGKTFLSLLAILCCC